MADAVKEPRRWYHWYSQKDNPEERRLILKLDLLIVPFAFLGYWLKYVDQANLNNAYVTGLKEDLGFHGNELVHLQVMYTVGCVVGQLPFAYFFTKVPMNWLIPGCEFGWGIFTLLQYRVQGYGVLMAYRFLVGLSEAAYFPGVHFVLGSWYRADEYGRRGGVFYIGLTLGTLTASLIQAGTSAGLDGVNGLAGWRWMYIINAVITLPVAICGFLVWPGTPDKPNKLVLSEKELALARARLLREGHSTPQHFSWKMAGRALTSWKFYFFTWWGTVFWNGNLGPSSGAYLLWLKSLHRFSKSDLNQWGALAPGLGIFYVLFVCFSSDLWLGRPGAITLAQTFNAISLIILIVWDVPEGAKWFAFAISYSCVAMSSVVYGWMNDMLKHNAAERAFIFTIANTIAQSTTAWTPLLTFPTVEAPRYRKGFAFTLSMGLCTLFTAWVARYLHKREEAQYEAAGLLEINRREAEEIKNAVTGADHKASPEILHESKTPSQTSLGA